MRLAPNSYWAFIIKWSKNLNFRLCLWCETQVPHDFSKPTDVSSGGQIYKEGHCDNFPKKGKVFKY